MSDLIRLSFTLDEGLFARLEELRRHRGYTNRSEFLRDALRSYMVQESWRTARGTVVGTLTLVYDHHAPGLTERLTEIQHTHHHQILATTHVHLDHNICVEVIILKGEPGSIEGLAAQLRRERGVLHAQLCTSSTGRELR